MKATVRIYPAQDRKRATLIGLAAIEFTTGAFAGTTISDIGIFNEATAGEGEQLRCSGVTGLQEHTFIGRIITQAFREGIVKFTIDCATCMVDNPDQVYGEGHPGGLISRSLSTVVEREHRRLYPQGCPNQCEACARRTAEMGGVL